MYCELFKNSDEKCNSICRTVKKEPQGGKGTAHSIPCNKQGTEICYKKCRFLKEKDIEKCKCICCPDKLGDDGCESDH